MSKKALLPMVLLLATAGCAVVGGEAGPKPGPAPAVTGQRQPPEARGAHFCPDKVCRVTVKVDDKCAVSVDPYYLVMAGKEEMTIVWTIKGEGTFAPDPVRWKQAAARSVFQRSKFAATEVAFTNNRTIGLFNYGITVKRGDKTCPELDPTGINDMP